MTHAELVQRGVKWLKGSQKCVHVFAEIVTSCAESPDVFGFRALGYSVLVEVKVSRSDFKADAKKTHRAPGKGLGRERWYLTPPGLLRVEELPDGWGLAEAHPKAVHVIRPASHREVYDHRGEVIILSSALRRWSLGVPFDPATCRFAAFGDEGHPKTIAERAKAEAREAHEAQRRANRGALFEMRGGQ